MYAAARLNVMILPVRPAPRPPPRRGGWVKDGIPEARYVPAWMDGFVLVQHGFFMHNSSFIEAGRWIGADSMCRRAIPNQVIEKGNDESMRPGSRRGAFTV